MYNRGMDLELAAMRVYGLAEASFGTSVSSLARRIVGPVLLVPPERMPCAACLFDDRIFIRADLSHGARTWAIAHELGEWCIRNICQCDGDPEEASDRLAACIIAPLPIAKDAATLCGADFRRLGQQLGLHRYGAALRYAEVTEEPLALVPINGESGVRVRGRPFAWPTNLRDFAVPGTATGFKTHPLGARVAILPSPRSPGTQPRLP